MSQQFSDHLLAMRRLEGLSSPRQIRFLESRGFLNVEAWSFEQAKSMIDRIAANGWQVPNSINPQEYRPECGIAHHTQGRQNAEEVGH